MDIFLNIIIYGSFISFFGIIGWKILDRIKKTKIKDFRKFCVSFFSLSGELVFNAIKAIVGIVLLILLIAFIIHFPLFSIILLLLIIAGKD